MDLELRRKLDLAVEQKVFGRREDMTKVDADMPDWSYSIKLAWDLVGHMVSAGLHVTVSSFPGGAWCEYGFARVGASWHAKRFPGDTAQEAICKAALDWKGVDLSTLSSASLPST